MALTYPGGYITKSPPAPTSTSAPGIWTMDQALQYIKAGTWPTPPIGDPYWANVSLLSGTGSTNASQNNNFIDSSGNGLNPTRNGNTTQGTFTPFTAPNGYWGNYFDGDADYLTVPYGSSLLFGGDNFTIEFFIYAQKSGTFQHLCGIWSETADAPQSYDIHLDTDNKVKLRADTSLNDDITIVASTTNLTFNQWVHVAVVRNGNTFTIYFNGVSVGTGTHTGSFQDGDGSQPFSIGGVPASSSSNKKSLTGYLSNFRVVKGSAVYTAAFTPPTSPLTAITNTSLLTCQSNRFVDTNTQLTAKVVSVFGNTAVIPFAPFGNTSMYSTTSVGGSGYFDGTGDYLQVGNNSAYSLDGDFTIEGWFYGSDYSSTIVLFQMGDSSSVVELWVSSASATLRAFLASTTMVSSSSMITNQWTHFALVREGTASNNISLYANGVRQAQMSSNSTFSGTANNGIRIGAEYPTATPWNGYMSGVRIIKGTAKYSGATYTVPTSPPTAESGTQFLLNFTNASIFDNAAKNDMETVGNAQVSTSVTKFGNSMSFDGTGDYLALQNVQNTNFGSGQFTIECWVYFNNVSGTQFIVSNYQSTTVGYGLGLSSGNFAFWATGDTPDISTSVAPATGTWYHLAVSGQTGAIKMFLNGNQIGSTYTGSTALDSTNTLRIGDGQGAASPQPLNGYVSNLRITKGLARYPYNFTPPTQAFGTIYKDFGTPTADPYFNYTTLLLSGTGTNGSNNNAFLDSSGNGLDPTRNGNTTQGTFSPFSQTGWSNYFNGSNSELTCTGSALSGQFTMEGWIFYTATPSSGMTYFGISSDNGGYVRQESTTTIGFNYAGIGNSLTCNFTPVVGQWYHIAVTRNASNLMNIWINGSSVGSATVATSYASGTFAIGANHYSGGTTGWFPGYISNVRLVTGSCLYTSSFTPSTTPLTAVSGTQILTCQSNRFVDNSTNAFAITVNGDTSVQAFSPFAPTAAYSAGTNGGSGYFDGTGDYLTVATTSALAFGTGDYTIEGWFYPTGTSDYFLFDMRTESGIYAYIEGSTGNNLVIATGGIAQTTAGTYRLNSWNHFAFVRSGSGSNNTSIYLNGTRTYQSTDTTNYSTNTGMYIGARYTATGPMVGYLSGYRVLKGTAQYSGATYTVPTSPPTNITNTSLLLNFTNAGITDATAKNDAETVGGAQISNGAAKWGSTSMYFDGNGDYLKSPDNPFIRLSSVDFTVEAWVYISSNQAQYDGAIVSYGSGFNGWAVALSGTASSTPYNRLLYGVNWAASGGAPLYGNTGVALNTWTHVAVTKYGSTVRLFINGNLDNSATVTATPNVSSSYSLYVGAQAYNPAETDRQFNGYIQDLRITSGIARYTQNFTPPTAAFQLL